MIDFVHFNKGFQKNGLCYNYLSAKKKQQFLLYPSRSSFLVRLQTKYVQVLKNLQLFSSPYFEGRFPSEGGRCNVFLLCDDVFIHARIVNLSLD